MSAVTPVAVSIQPKIDAAATMKSTVRVVSTVSRQTLTNIFQLSVRYQAKPRIIAHTQAAIAPSVGVNRPVVMPPISSTGVMIGSSASKRKIRSSTNSSAEADEDRDLRRRADLRDHRPQQQRPADDHRELAHRLARSASRENLTSAPHLFLCA